MPQGVQIAHLGDRRYATICFCGVYGPIATTQRGAVREAEKCGWNIHKGLCPTCAYDWKVAIDASIMDILGGGDDE